MWLLKLHFSISVLCLLTFLGFRSVCKEMIEKNGYWEDKDKKKAKLSSLLLFFVPFLNIILVIALFIMITIPKSDYEKKCQELNEANANKEQE